MIMIMIIFHQGPFSYYSTNISSVAGCNSAYRHDIIPPGVTGYPIIIMTLT